MWPANGLEDPQPPKDDQGPEPGLVPWPGPLCVERVTRIELALSAREVCATAAWLPADSLTCGLFGALSASDRDWLQLLLRPGLQRARTFLSAGLGGSSSTAAAGSDRRAAPAGRRTSTPRSPGGWAYPNESCAPTWKYLLRLLSESCPLPRRPGRACVCCGQLISNSLPSGSFIPTA